MSISILKDGNGDELSAGTIAIHAAMVPSASGAMRRMAAGAGIRPPLSVANGEVPAVAGQLFTGSKAVNPDWKEGQPDPANPPQYIDDATGADDSQFVPLAPESLKALVRNYPQCLVAELHFGHAPIPDRANGDGKPPGTPANDDNLARLWLRQR